MQPHLHILLPQITERARFTFQHLFTDYLGWTFSLEETEQPHPHFPTISCFPKPLEGILHLPPGELLFSKSTEASVNFPSSALEITQNYFPFELPSVAFFLLSNMQEKVDDKRDQWNRLPASARVAQQNGVYHQNIIGRWASLLGQWIQTHHPEMTPGSLPQIEQITVDVDHLYQEFGKPLLPFLRGALGCVRRGQFQNLHQRFQWWKGKEQDPFDHFDRYPSSSILFIQMGNQGNIDKSLGAKNLHFRRKIKELSESFTIGLHPSSIATQSLSELQKEKSHLEEIIGKSVTQSRQHYLLSTPNLWNNLEEVGILQDYTALSADENGFQLGTALPVNHYDFKREKISDLIRVPSAWMDATGYHYLHLSEKEMVENHQKMKMESLQFGGIWCPVYHNNYPLFLDEVK
jgi:hypothetical protein